MIVVFVLVALLGLSALVAANWLVWRRLFRDTTRGPGIVRRAGVVVICGGWALTVGTFVSVWTDAPFRLLQVLAWPGYLWLVLSIYLLLWVLAGEAVRPLLLRRSEQRAVPKDAVSAREPVPTEATPAASPATTSDRVTSTSPASVIDPEPGARTAGPVEPSGRLSVPTRRLFVSRVIAGAAATAAVGTVGYGTYGVLRGPKVKRVTVPVAKLPRAADGYRIAVVSDIHLGPVLGRGFAQKVVDTINGTQPDLIAVVGDLVDGSVPDLGPAVAPLAGLRARHGAFFVTGNHEYYSGAEQWVEEVRRLGLRPLENARTELPQFDLAGVNDIEGESTGQGPDFARALGDRDRARACVLLAHQPVMIHDAVEHGVDLQLSGHTHGGQLWPANILANLTSPTVAGLERYGDTQLYVSRGAGAAGPPTRVGAPSDITVIELASLRA
ncbi:metallophosphoesterase [Streptomyces sp. B3I8]|uniref:metallophosphoesterase n=1 Tax=Streptomyces sp. B3I8 TaxID=3042303 RepID=UPI0027853223|nr:metallophosphoesterase [Streptomyces sp. B3I8]MDQ0786703.1 putative MPP superfamily phosphohydrolase [Streptomyces sp. B3I8]